MRLVPAVWELKHILVLCIMAFVAGLWLGWEAFQLVAVDRCLDRGGAWEYGDWYCQFR